MHELAITQSMFDIVMQHAAQSSAKKVKKINLVIGEMTGVAADSVELYLELLSKGTIAEGAKANIKMVPPQAKCANCGKIFIVKETQWKCPACGNANLDVVAGKELFVESIEVD